MHGAEELIGAGGSMVAIALGVLCGHPLYRALARAVRWTARDLAADDELPLTDAGKALP